VLHHTCGSVAKDLAMLTRAVQCKIIASRVRAEQLGEQVCADGAHLGVNIGDDGETCQVFDQRGCSVPTRSLLPALVRLRLEGQSLANRPTDGNSPRPLAGEGQGVRVCHDELPSGSPSLATVVLEQETSKAAEAAVRTTGARVVRSQPRRSAMAAAIRRHGAIFGGGPSGRFWYDHLGHPLPDGLMTITLLLTLLSRSDRPLSSVLDRAAAVR
jgi:hypothetical protein